MSTSLVLTLLAAIGGPAGIVALVMILPQIKKLQADTSKVERDAENADIDGASILSAAALAQMNAAVDRAKRAEAHVDRLETVMAEMRKRLDTMEYTLYEYRQVAQDHVAWDVTRIKELVAMGVTETDIPIAPPLLPRLGGKV